MTLSFVLLLCFFFGTEMEGTGVGSEDLSIRTVFFFFFLFSFFTTRTSTHVQSVTRHPLLGLLISLHGSSCNHRLQAMWRGEEGRGRQWGEEIYAYISNIWKSTFYYFMLLCWGLGGYTRHVSHFAIGFHQQSTFEETQSKKCHLGVHFLSACMLLFPINVLPHFLYVFFSSFDGVPPKCCCVSGCLLTDNCKEVVFTGFTQAESSVLS